MGLGGSLNNVPPPWKGEGIIGKISITFVYNLVTEDELLRIKWPEERRITGAMDTYVDTDGKKEVNQNG
jgi:hypothetical protein